MIPGNYLAIMSAPSQVLLQALCALECKNVKIESAAHPAQQRRAAHKNLPLVSYKVLALDSSTKEVSSSHAVGTHASPRTHLRRGHIRRLIGGNVWIDATVVNGGANGMIVKDYQVA
jgi:hypothetical protein